MIPHPCRGTVKKRSGAVDTVVAVIGTVLLSAGAAWSMVEVRVNGTERLIEAQRDAAKAEHAAIRRELELIRQLLTRALPE